VNPTGLLRSGPLPRNMAILSTSVETTDNE
jgi:hypothetical protein